MKIREKNKKEIGTKKAIEYYTRHIGPPGKAREGPGWVSRGSREEPGRSTEGAREAGRAWEGSGQGSPK